MYAEPPRPRFTKSLTMHLYPFLPCNVLQLTTKSITNAAGGIRYILSTDRKQWLSMAPDENWQEGPKVLASLKANYAYYREIFPHVPVGAFPTYSFSSYVSDEYLLADKYNLPGAIPDVEPVEEPVSDVDEDAVVVEVPDEQDEALRAAKRPRTDLPLPADAPVEEVLELEGGSPVGQLTSSQLQRMLDQVPSDEPEVVDVTLNHLLGASQIGVFKEPKLSASMARKEARIRQNLERAPKKFSLKKPAPLVKPQSTRRSNAARQNAAQTLASLVHQPTNNTRPTNANLSAMLLPPQQVTSRPMIIRRADPPTPVQIRPTASVQRALPPPPATSPLRRPPTLPPPTTVIQTRVQPPSPYLRHIQQNSTVLNNTALSAAGMTFHTAPRTTIFHNKLFPATPPPTANRNALASRNTTVVPPPVQAYRPPPAPVQRELSSNYILDQLSNFNLPANSQDLNALLMPPPRQSSFTMDPLPDAQMQNLFGPDEDDEDLLDVLPPQVTAAPVNNASTTSRGTGVPLSLQLGQNPFANFDAQRLLAWQEALEQDSQVYVNANSQVARNNFEDDDNDFGF